MPVIESFSEHILTLEISRPERRNTLDAAMLSELTAAFEKASADEEVRVVVLCAQPGIFCAGGDLTEQIKDLNADEDSPSGRMLAALSGCTKPVIACVEGPAVGLAVTMLYYCDLVYAGSRALFSLPFTALGLTPRFGVSFLAATSCGLHKAAEKILLSEPITAQEALSMGIVSGVLDDAQVKEQTLARASRLAKLSPLAVQSSKRVLRSSLQEALLAMQKIEAQTFNEVARSEQAKEACDAFLEGRMPKF